MEKALCKLQKQFSIPSIVYDMEKNTVTVSGPFNPECFVKKLRCLACKVIIDIQIIVVIDPVPEPPTNIQQTTTNIEVAVNLIMCAYPPPVSPAGCDKPCSCYKPCQSCRRCCSCSCSCNKPPSLCPEVCPPRSGAEGCKSFEFCKIELESSPACSMM